MNEISRLLNLVPYISTHQGISVSELAGTFGVTEKELHKDLMTLFMCGLPGYTPLELMEVDFENGFVTIRNADTLKKPRSLSTDEICLVILGLSLLRELSPEQGERISELLNKLVDLLGFPFEVTSDKSVVASSVIQRAIDSGKQVSFSYISRYSDEKKEHSVSPISIFTQNSVLYLKGYSHSSQGLRTFELSRILDLKQDTEASVFPDVEEKRIRLKLTIKNRYRKFMEFFHSEEPETFSEIWAVRALVAAGGDVELSEPRDLRPEIAARARIALAQYQSLG